MDSTQITARAPQELVRRLDRFAEETHRTRAGAILLFLEQGLTSPLTRNRSPAFVL